MTEAELEKQLAQNLQDEIKREAEKAKRVPTPFRLGPLHTLREAAEQMGVGALKALPDGRGYALDAQGRLELASLALATMKSKKNLTAVIEAMADTPVILVLDDGKGGKIEKIVYNFGHWRQERPPADAGTIPELSIDKATGLRVRNPWLPLPPRPGETTPRFDHKSQHVIKEQSPRLAKWLEECAENDGLPSAAMLDELEAEKIKAAYLRKLEYGDKEWQANLLRPDSGATGTEKANFVRSIEDYHLVEFHRDEAKAGSPRFHFGNLTFAMALAKRSPEAREVHKQAGEILKAWQQEERDKVAA